MENKNNFTGIIIPVIVAVILLTVLPIVNSMNVECPPCEECPSYNIGNIEVNPNFASGNYIVDKGSYDYIDSANIIKDVDLIPENIKKDAEIFGVVGTYEGSSEIPNNEAILVVENNVLENDLFPITVNLFNMFEDGMIEVNLYGKTSGSAPETLLATFKTEGYGYYIYFYLLEKSNYNFLKFTFTDTEDSYVLYGNLYQFHQNSDTVSKRNADVYFAIESTTTSMTIRAVNAYS